MRPVMRRPVYMSALCLVLAACTAQPHRPADPTPVAATPATTQNDAAPVSEDAPVRTVAIDPASLMGMTGARIASLFGDPVFVRRDGPGEFWRYRGKSCVLELFFYPQEGAQRVRHLETRASGGKTLNKADCVAAFRKKAAKS